MAKIIYDNNSISMLKGADRVRKRPGVIFGSDDVKPHTTKVTSMRRPTGQYPPLTQ